MPATFSENATFWRGCCLVIASIAAIEALCLVFIAPTGPTSPPVISSPPASVLPAATPDAAAAPEKDVEQIRASSSARALASKDPRRRARAWEDRGISLAEKDPEAALRALAELEPGAERNAMTRGVFETLAHGDAAEAIAYAKQTAPGREREAALTALLDGWSGPWNEDSLSQRAHLIASEGLEAGLGEELVFGNPPRPDLAVLWAQGLTSGKGKAELLGIAAGIQVRTDPALAASYGEGLTGQDQLTFSRNMVSSWARVQPDAAWQWSSALADPAVREHAQNAAVAAQSAADLPGAMARLALLPDDTQRTETLREIANHFANQNTDAAMAWAQTLPPADQPVANAAINAAAPVGAGVMLLQDEDGYGVVMGIFPNTGAAQSGAIHKGDRIVAISQGNNQFVDVQQLELEKLVNLIRGPSGSLVQLQVAPALPGGGFGTPTTVSIVRQQLKHGG